MSGYRIPIFRWKTARGVFTAQREASRYELQLETTDKRRVSISIGPKVMDALLKWVVGIDAGFEMPTSERRKQWMIDLAISELEDKNYEQAKKALFGKHPAMECFK